jgi:hypothetical protein
MTDFIVTENYHLRLKPATAKILIEKISLSFDAAMNYKTKNHTDQNILFDKDLRCHSFAATVAKNPKCIFHCSHEHLFCNAYYSLILCQ